MGATDQEWELDRSNRNAAQKGEYRPHMDVGQKPLECCTERWVLVMWRDSSDDRMLPGVWKVLFCVRGRHHTSDEHETCSGLLALEVCEACLSLTMWWLRHVYSVICYTCIYLRSLIILFRMGKYFCILIYAMFFLVCVRLK